MCIFPNFVKFSRLTFMSISIMSANYLVWFVMFSGSDDNIFVYFTDHGAPDIIAFPDDEVR